MDELACQDERFQPFFDEKRIAFSQIAEGIENIGGNGAFQPKYAADH